MERVAESQNIHLRSIVIFAKERKYVTVITLLARMLSTAKITERAKYSISVRFDLPGLLSIVLFLH